MEKWVDELWTNNGSGSIPFAILANKSDLREKDPSKVISKEETEELINNFRKKMLEKAKFKFAFLETSALDGINVDEAFDILLKEILENTLNE